MRSTDGTSWRRLPSLKTLSDENVGMMHSWIRSCKSTHGACRRAPGSSPWLPTRLLDVGSDDGSREPRVIETKDLSTTDTPYAALSHMWGDVENAAPLQTMKFNYDTVKQNVSNRKLPQNFADAVEVCRKLSIQYIWIDSLCIIQDDQGDWAQEAKMMHKVYRNAEVTIVA
jgi:hypothetical protein